MVDYKNILTGVAERLSVLREERPSAGTRYRLMGMVADIMEVAETLQKEVLERVRQEAVLDADVDADFDVMAEEVLSWELTIKNDALQEPTQQVNDALGGLSDVLTQIGSQLSRRHKDEEYARLYEQEKRRYLSSGTPRRVRQTFEDWLYDVCNGSPCMDDINAYVTEKLVHMFEKGVFDSKVEHIQRATRYPAEFDFSLLDDDHKLKKSIHKHYSELRKLVDYCDGFLVVNPVKVGRHFYTNRKEEKYESEGGERQGAPQCLPEVHAQDYVGTGGAQKTVGGRGHTEGGLGERTELFCSGEESEGAVDRRVVRHVDGRREALYDQVASRFCGCADGFRVA